MINIRLWHFALIPYLPKQMLVSQWRECIAIKRQWEKGTLKHRLVSYVMRHDKKGFLYYINKVIIEMAKRNLKYSKQLYIEMVNFCTTSIRLDNFNYPEHDDKYLRQCLYNLEEKAIRGIISKEEWLKIYNKFKYDFNLWNGEE